MLILRGHEDTVRCLSYSPDGRYLASGSEDETARLWDLAGDGAVAASIGHSTSVEAFVFFPEGRTFVTGTSEGSLLAWNLSEENAGNPLPARNPFLAHRGGIRCLTRTRDGDSMVTSGWDQRVKVWEGAAVKERYLFHYGPMCTALSFDPQETTLAVGTENASILLYDFRTGGCRHTLRANVPLYALTWSPNNPLLASGHADGTVILWDANALRQRATLRGHTWTVYSLAFTPDGRTLISGSADGTVRLWNVQTGQERRCCRWHTSWVTCVAVAPDGMTAVAGSADCTVVVWDLEE